MFHKFTLKNNLRVIVVPVGQAKAVTVLVVVQTGSRNETKETNGVSHFLEHMVFKGTKKWPKSKVMSEAIDGVGGEHNAFTDHDVTGYWIKVPPAHLDLALEIVADMFSHALLHPRELERERRVILEELNMNHDSPQRHVWDVFAEALWGDQPAGRPIGGTIESVKGITHPQVVAYLKAHYTAQATIVCVAGDVKPDKVRALASRHFAGIATHEPPQKPAVIDHQKGVALKFVERPTDQTHFVLGMRAFPVSDKRRFALAALADLLGGMMSSRLFIRVRDKKGLAYYIRTGADLDSETGFMATSAGVANGKLDEAIIEILREFKSLARSLVGGKELNKVKEHLKGQLLLGLETTDTYAYFFSEQEAITGSVLTPEEQMRKIDTVSAKDIRALVRFLFKPERLTFAAVGPAMNRRHLHAILNSQF